MLLEQGPCPGVPSKPRAVRPCQGPTSCRRDAGARVADKTGSGEHGTTNDVGVLWLPEREPVVIAAYLTATPASAELRNAVLADAARLALRQLSL
jgi:beta-lactamase class A